MKWIILNDYLITRKRLLFRPLGPLENIQQIAYNAPNFNESKSIETLVTKNEDMSRVLIFVNNKKFRYASRSY
jgi:ATP-dependent RNA helicase RhlE